MLKRMTYQELEDEIDETKLTIAHLSMIGEEDTARLIVGYLQTLLDERMTQPSLHIVQ